VSAFDVKLFGEVALTLFVIVDPLGNIPLFLSLLRGRDAHARRRAAWQAVGTSLGVIGAFAVLGRQILDYLGITVPALQVAGGLLLLLVALELLTGKDSAPEEVRDVNVALVPLGTPLLAGPGAIVAVIVFVQGVRGAGQGLAVAAGVIVIHLVLLLILLASTLITRLIGEGAIALLTRISGLLLSAIAVQLVAEGVRGFTAA